LAGWTKKLNIQIADADSSDHIRVIHPTAGLANLNQCDLNRDLNQLIFCQKNQVI